MIETHLTSAQAARMEEIGREDEDARVVGWEPLRGPLVVRGDGRVQTVTPVGRLLSRTGIGVARRLPRFR